MSTFSNTFFVRNILPNLSGFFGCYEHEWVKLPIIWDGHTSERFMTSNPWYINDVLYASITGSSDQRSNSKTIDTQVLSSLPPVGFK